MKGKRSGLKTLVQNHNPRAVYLHCYAHTLQLAVQDSTKDVRMLSDALGMAAEISKLIKRSPKRDAAFKKLQDEMTSGPNVGIRTLCPTR